MLKETLLAKIPLFSGFSVPDRTALAVSLRERALRKGDTVFVKGDLGTSMFVVFSGGLRIYLPPPSLGMPPLVLQELHPGEYFGELALFDDQPRSASVAATEDSLVGELTRQDLLEHLQNSPTAIVALLGEMSGRLRRTNALLSERAAKDVSREVDERLTWGQRLADRVADLNGSWAFILFLIGLSFAWAIANKVLQTPFDEYPYQFFNLALAILVALQGPLIVMSQNRQSMKDRMTSESDFRVNLKNEIGIEQILQQLSALRAEVRARQSEVSHAPGEAEVVPARPSAKR